MSHIEQIPPELTWRIREQVLYPGKNPEYSKLPEDYNGLHFGLFDHNILISVVSLFKHDTGMQFRKFATLHEFQGKGYGTELLDHLMDTAKTEGCERVWCNARKRASGFYGKFGFLETEQTFKKYGHDYVIMEKIL